MRQRIATFQDLYPIYSAQNWIISNLCLCLDAPVWNALLGGKLIGIGPKKVEIFIWGFDK